MALGLLLCLRLPAQSDPYLEHFSITHDDGRVLLNWVTRPGSTCEGIDIMRSTDSIHYTSIHHIGGICGGPNSAISYSHIDESPVVNHRNYYRLQLGTVGTTSVRAIEVVDLQGNGFLIRPNPVVETSRIYFDNVSHALHRLSLIDLQGVVRQTLETRDEFFIVEAAALQPNLYFLHIQDEEGRFKAQGKLLVR
jgi:hypothetical protein